MIDVSQLPSVRAQLARDTAARAEAVPQAPGQQYVRAPAATTPQQAGARPPAMQRSAR
jgi:hypothetical protein